MTEVIPVDSRVMHRLPEFTEMDNTADTFPNEAEDETTLRESASDSSNPPSSHEYGLHPGSGTPKILRRFPSLSHSMTGWRSSRSPSSSQEEQSDLPKEEEEISCEPTRPLPPVGFFDSTLSKTRSSVYFKYAWTLLILCLFVLAVLSIYWGILFRVRENLHNATIAVVNFDGQLAPYDNVVPLVGPAVEQALRQEMTTQFPLGFKFLPPADFNNDPLAVRLAVHEEHYWAAIIINANATALLKEAVETGNSSYDPFGAGAVITNQARDIESYNQYITPVLTRLAAEITFSFGRNWTSSVLNNASLSQEVYSRTPQALSPGIGFTIFNLRPFDPPTAIPAVSIGLIYLIIIAFFSFGFFIPTHMRFVLPNSASPHPPLKFTHFIVWRYFATIVAYLFLSLCYSLVSLAFQIPFSRTPPPGLSSWPKTDVAENANYLGRATFVVYWLLNWAGMAALGLACENVAMIIGQPWTALWLIFWVITNVSTGFYALELAPAFFRWGYAWPLRQVVYASRTLLFGTHDRLGLNFGILLAWIVVGTALFPLCCWVMRWKTMKQTKNVVGKV